MASITYRGLWRWHFHAGLLCIPFVQVLALTGAIYLFKPQLDARADRGADSLPVTGHRASAAAHIDAALAALPGSRLFVHEVPQEPDDAVRVHIYAPDATGRIVYVHPESLAVLKIVPHTARFTEIVRTIHGELFAGKTGTILIEFAASWAIVMLITGLYLWWPREGARFAGVLYPRIPAGGRVFWHVRSETQNRPRVRELELYAASGELLRSRGFAAKPVLDRVVGIGAPLKVAIVALGVFLPLLGASLVILALTTKMASDPIS